MLNKVMWKLLIVVVIMRNLPLELASKECSVTNGYHNSFSSALAKKKLEEISGGNILVF